MTWPEVRQTYSNQWLIVEALEAHSLPNSQRQLDHLAVLERCADGQAAFNRYHHYHQQYPQREFYFVHTSREQLDIRERRWLGVRLDHAISSAT